MNEGDGEGNGEGDGKGESEGESEGKGEGEGKGRVVVEGAKVGLDLGEARVCPCYLSFLPRAQQHCGVARESQRG